jgi:hypothetical protein
MRECAPVAEVDETIYTCTKASHQRLTSTFDSWRDCHGVHVLEMPFCSFDALNIMAQGFVIGLNLSGFPLLC